jgi:hypothetical protein
MGGQTQEKNTTTSQNTAFGQSQQQQQQQQGATSQSLTPWLTTSAQLTDILNRLAGIPSGLTSAESGALDQLAGVAGGGNPYAPAIGDVANMLLGGGTDRSDVALDAYNKYLAGIAPTASGAYLDPSSNPFYANVTNTIGNDVENRLKGMYAAAGRDPAGAGNYGYQLARGIGEATAPVFQSQYNTERQNQLNALTGMPSAGNATAGLLSSLDQARYANMQAGINAATAANNAQMWGPTQMLAIEAQRRGIPLQALATEYGMVLPAAQAFGTTAGTTSSSQSGSSSSAGTQHGQGTQDTTTSTPFNPWSLAPLALMPFTGGASLAGMAGSALGGGLFSSLSNNFLGGSNWLR